MDIVSDFANIDLQSIVSTINRYGLCQVQLGLYPTGNTQATFSSPANSRSESAIAINPKNEKNMIGVSKKFIEPSIYHFQLGVVYTFDRGATWKESSLPMHSGWDGMTDPTVAFDRLGNAFLVGEPLRLNREKTGTGGDLTGLGMWVYRSQDGGVTWGDPTELTADTEDDKQQVICDNNPYSPHYGNVYVCWGANSPLRFCRSTDHGNTWRGKGSEQPGSSLVSYSFAPEMSVSSDGTLHILWHNDGSGVVNYIRSTDGGETFSQQRIVVNGISSLRGHLPETGGWPHFDYGKFRVITLVSDCVTPANTLIVSWADMREGRSRIYYRRSLDNGVTWDGPDSGQPLLPHVQYGDWHCFHPQIAVTQTGVIGCAFYVFGKEYNRHAIRVQLASSWDEGKTFNPFITLTDQSWDPLVNAPFAHGNPNVHFIGEYFGLDAGYENFAILWTDTRSGVQELFSDVVDTRAIRCPQIPEIIGQIFGGVAQDGGGWIIVNGKIIKIPPRSPVLEVLQALNLLVSTGEELVGQDHQLEVAALQSITQWAERQMEALSGNGNRISPSVENLVEPGES